MPHTIGEKSCTHRRLSKAAIWLLAKEAAPYYNNNLAAEPQSTDKLWFSLMVVQETAVVSVVHEPGQLELECLKVSNWQCSFQLGFRHSVFIYVFVLDKEEASKWQLTSGEGILLLFVPCKPWYIWRVIAGRKAVLQGEEKQEEGSEVLTGKRETRPSGEQPGHLAARCPWLTVLVQPPGAHRCPYYSHIFNCKHMVIG